VKAISEMEMPCPIISLASAIRHRSFTKSAKSIEGFALRLPNGSALDLEQFLGATSTDAMVVLRDGELVYETYPRGDRKAPFAGLKRTIGNG
jgi:hypothetical protein